LDEDALCRIGFPNGRRERNTRVTKESAKATGRFSLLLRSFPAPLARLIGGVQFTRNLCLRSVSVCVLPVLFLADRTDMPICTFPAIITEKGLGRILGTDTELHALEPNSAALNSVTVPELPLTKWTDPIAQRRARFGAGLKMDRSADLPLFLLCAHGLGRINTSGFLSL
jgi:hypothetical protein